MKRLKYASNQTLFHGTILTSAKNIIEIGSFEPQYSAGGGEIVVKENVDNFDKKYNGYTFFTDDYEYAISYAMSNTNRNSNEPIVVFEVNIPEEVLFPDDISCPNCVDWKESLTTCSQVKVLGSVSINNVNNIILIYNSKEIDTTVQDFENDLLRVLK